MTTSVATFQTILFGKYRRRIKINLEALTLSRALRIKIYKIIVGIKYYISFRCII